MNSELKILSACQHSFLILTTNIIADVLVFFHHCKMFSSKGRLDRKTGPDGVDRQHYLQELVDEFQSTETITGQYYTSLTLGYCKP